MMGKMTFSLLVATMTIAFAVSSPTLAQDAQSGKGRNMPAFADCDLNGDGAITAEEFNKARAERIAKRAQEGRRMKNLANAPSFDEIDTNDDGTISPAEFSAHQAAQRAKMQRG
ncbi:MAG: EF-hand domain-containing protein [Gammaproteobacteria bacterium]|nr:EF-hand domain-containing protein [Gammaproteobacteria bacterium]MDH3431982.1 EF-hand domain-containing protein [Gammaproteobacteria bacterium]